MKLLYVIGLCIAVIAPPAFALTDEQKAARVGLTNEFIRELSAAQDLQGILERDNALDISGLVEISTILRTSTQASTELKTARRLLNEQQLGSAMDEIRVRLNKIYEQKLTMNQEIIEDAKDF